ncbi:MAG: hypothetical protein CR982_04885 [Candidatus Cloacimonadota bacterium]|nr:MAG: hypothetical protein CR982_04885 [Candidatus Cloacimonadota bacterium]PIE77368.1 MAG: hypothetical protein CSA15_13280 [Candidatus Delongbacteria bacterium]
MKPFTILLFLATIVFADNSNLFKKADEFDRKRDYASAIEELQKIEKEALREKDNKLLFKAFIKRFNISNYFYRKEESKLLDLLKEMKPKFKNDEILIDLTKYFYLKRYYNRNRYRIENMPITGEDSKDLADWDKLTFENKLYTLAKKISKKIDKASTYKLSDYNMFDKMYRQIFYGNNVDIITYFEFCSVADLFTITLLDDGNLGIQYGEEDTKAGLKNYKFFSTGNRFLDLGIENINNLSKKNSLEREILDYYKFNHIITNSYTIGEKELAKIVVEKFNNSNFNSVKVLYLSRYPQYKSKDFDPDLKFLHEKLTKLVPKIEIKRINQLGKNIIEELESKDVRISRELNDTKDLAIPFNIYYKNIDKAELEIYKLKRSELLSENFYKNSYKFYKELGKRDPEIKKSIELKKFDDFKEHSFLTSLKFDDYGTYALFVIDPKNKSKRDRKIIIISQYEPSVFEVGNRALISLKDRYSGEKCEDFTVTVIKEDKEVKFESDDDILDIDINSLKKWNNSTLYLKGYFTTENGTFPMDMGAIYTPNIRLTMNENLNIYTDRAVYMPGDKIKISILKTTPPKSKNERGKIVEILDPNFALVSHNGYRVFDKRLNVKSNRVDYEINIPLGVPAGRYMIEVSERSTRGKASVIIENYTKKNFEIELEKVSKDISNLDKIEINGKVKSTSGYSIQSPKLSYKISETNYPSFRHFYNIRSKILEEGSIEGDKNGNFNFVFNRPKSKGYSIISVEISTVDESGMRETKNLDLYFGKEPINLLVNTKDYIVDTDKPRFSIGANNIQGDSIKVEGEYKLYKLKSYKKNHRYGFDTSYNGTDIENPVKTFPYDGFDYKKFEEREKKLISKGKFNSNENLDIDYPQNFGIYKLEAVYKSGEKIIEKSSFFKVYEIDEKLPDNDSFICIKGEKDPFKNGKIDLFLGSSLSDKEIDIIVKDNEGTKEILNVELDEELKKITIDTKDFKGTSIKVIGSMEGLNREYRFSENYNYIPPQKLKLEILDLPKESKPNEKESIKFKVTDLKGKPVKNSFIYATMFNKSLEDINKYSFSLPNNRIKYKPVELSQLSNVFQDKTDDYFERGSAYNQSLNVMGARSMATMESDKSVQPNYLSSKSNKGVESSGKTDMIFREFKSDNVFFATKLKTDKDGVASFEYNSSQETGTYTLKAITIDEDLKNGLASEDVVVNKKFYLETVIPQYFYEGDKTQILFKAINLSKLSTKASLEIKILSPNGKDITKSFLGKNRSKISLNIPKGSYKTAEFDLEIKGVNYPVEIEILGNSDNLGKDGLKFIVPVLSNKVRFTDSDPFTIEPKKSKKIDLKNMKNSYDNYTIEVTTNPLWYLISEIELPNNTQKNIYQILGDIINLSNRLEIIRNNPKLQNVLISLKKSGEKSSFLSLMNRNPELKTFIYENTPWFKDLLSDSEILDKSIEMFDQNATRAALNNCVINLENFKNKAKGSYKYSNSTNYSIYTTISTIETMIIMDIIGVKEIDPKRIIAGSKEYLISELKKLNKEDKNIGLGEKISSILKFIDSKSIEKDKELKKIVDKYMKDIDSSFFKKNIKNQLIISWCLKQSTKFSYLQDELYKSVKGRLKKSNFGKFIDEGNSLISTVYASYIFKEKNDIKNLNSLKQYIISSKRTLNYSSDKSILPIAISLFTDQKILRSKDSFKLLIDGKELGDDDLLNLPGYIKKSYTAGDKRVPKSIEVINNGDSQIWAAVYKSGFKRADEIESRSSAIKIEREYLVYDKNGKYKKSKTFKKGDKILVKLKIKNKVNYSDLHIKDYRPKSFISREKSGYKKLGQSYGYIAYERAHTDIFLNYLSRGTTVLSYELQALENGEFSTGPVEISSSLAPEFRGRSEGLKVIVK